MNVAEELLIGRKKMARTQRKHRPPIKKEQKENKVKRENLRLRRLNKRYRRDLKDMRGILINVRRAIDKGDMLRALAYIPEKIKHPPAELAECKHEYTFTHVYKCKYCGDTNG